MTPLRVGRVDFINTFPLAWSLGQRLEAGAIDETFATSRAPSASSAFSSVGTPRVSSSASGPSRRSSDQASGNVLM